MKKLLPLFILFTTLNSFSQVFSEGKTYKTITDCRNDSCVSVAWEHIDSTIEIEGDTIQAIRMLLNIIAAKDSISNIFRKQISEGIRWTNNKNKPINETHFTINRFYRKP